MVKMEVVGCGLEGIRSKCKDCQCSYNTEICEFIRKANNWKVYYGEEMTIKTKDRIKRLLWDTKRNGVSKIVDYLEHHTDFFEAPASTKHHLARKGGLAEHSLSVYETMVRLNDEFKLDIPLHQIVITGLLHDLCKTNYYIQEVESVSGRSEFGRYTGKWVVEDKLPLGHGEKSLYLVSKYLTLSDAEAAAIRWHMGCWTAGVTMDKGLSQSFNSAAKEYPLVTLLITVDCLSSRLLEEG